MYVWAWAPCFNWHVWLMSAAGWMVWWPRRGGSTDTFDRIVEVQSGTAPVRKSYFPYILKSWVIFLWYLKYAWKYLAFLSVFHYFWILGRFMTGFCLVLWLIGPFYDWSAVPVPIFLGNTLYLPRGLRLWGSPRGGEPRGVDPKGEPREGNPGGGPCPGGGPWGETQGGLGTRVISFYIHLIVFERINQPVIDFEKKRIVERFAIQIFEIYLKLWFWLA